MCRVEKRRPWPCPCCNRKNEGWSLTCCHAHMESSKCTLEVNTEIVDCPPLERSDSNCRHCQENLRRIQEMYRQSSAEHSSYPPETYTPPRRWPPASDATENLESPPRPGEWRWMWIPAGYYCLFLSPGNWVRDETAPAMDTDSRPSGGLVPKGEAKVRAQSDGRSHERVRKKKGR